ncbi:mechanosensitive ion channel family protein [Acidihalobacter prosperus]
MSKLARILFVTLSLLATSAASAADAKIDAAAVRADQTAVERIARQIDRNTLTSNDNFKQLIEQVTGYKSLAGDCISSQQAESDNISQQVKALGPAVKGESWQVTSTRLQLERQQTQTSQLLASCRLLEVSSANVLRNLLKLQNERLTSRLQTRGPPTGRIIEQLLPELSKPGKLFNVRLLQERLGTGSPDTWYWLGALSLIGLAAGFLWRRRLARAPSVDPEQDLTRAVFQAILASLNRYRPGLLVSGLWSVYWLAIGPAAWGWPLLAGISFLLFAYHMALAAIRASFNPPPPALPYLPFSKPLAQSFGKSLRWLALNAAVGAAIFATPIADASSPNLILLARSLWGTLLVCNIIWTVWLIRSLRGKQGVGPIRVTIAILLLGGLAAEWTGYRDFSQFIVGGVALTLVSLLIAWLVSALSGDLIDSMDEGRHAWERRIKERLGVSENNFVPGLFWLRILIHILIWAALIFALMRVWGVPTTAQMVLLRWATHGFTVGQVTIEPTRVLIALMVLALLLSLGSWARTLLDQRLSHARLERGAREAAVAITGYGIIIAAALIALVVAGVAFQNLALIAGALSVGIGFGLQNIVNNFVSGLILLFERPIRTGDWIVVGSVEGFVRRISIRSTQIQTFDRADVIVPNSDLISGSVTNWMLRDTYGRVRVPVGVAYGSDTQQVKDILLRIAKEHPLVIQDSSAIPNPYVLFLSFGDSSLNFELRAYIRDVGERLTVVSDLNFAIDAAFREAGIQIPFPQRDVHIIAPSQEPPSPPDQGGEREPPA